MCCKTTVIHTAQRLVTPPPASPPNLYYLRSTLYMSDDGRVGEEAWQTRGKASFSSSNPHPNHPSLNFQPSPIPPPITPPELKTTVGVSQSAQFITPSYAVRPSTCPPGGMHVSKNTQTIGPYI